jgi:5-methylcytosine-specific restriction endonuclease McrA
MRDYSSKDYKAARKKSLIRDGRKCQMPGCKAKKKLQSHHIMTWAKAIHLRYDVDNLITLCRTCHESIKNKEDFYVSLFKGIVRDNTKRH